MGLDLLGKRALDTIGGASTSGKMAHQVQNQTMSLSSPISAEHRVSQVVNVVHDLFLHFDLLVEKHCIYKVETIGDAFMCAGGVPDACNAVEAAGAVANMAFDMIAVSTAGACGA